MVEVQGNELRLEQDAYLEEVNTISDVKHKVFEKIGVPANHQQISFGGRTLEDDKSLAFYFIEGDLTLHDLIIRAELHRIETRLCEMEDLLRKRGAQLHEKEGITEDIEDIFSGGRLQDDQRQDEDITLASRHMKSDSTLNLVFCPKHLISFSVKAPSGDVVKLKVEILFTDAFVVEQVGRDTLLPSSIQKEFLLEMSPSCIELANTIKDVKGMLFDKLWIPINRQSFVYAGKKLEADSNIERHSTLHMVFAPSSKFIKMKLNTIDLPISRFTTISEMKTMARVKFQDLIKEVLFREVVLEDERPLADYGITLNAEVTVVFEA
ncbi:polyubiquitin-C-like [Pistacia vera]|uniref:polyubiquitin-C-like n=1 Tax=Pistacia vera TaxID=55513 RepID=UPI001263A2DF|nr:polyubiquitin-C-like [Pistacia vera]